MKKVLVAIMAMFCSMSSFAQYSSGGFSLDEENIYWGVRFGMTAASLSGDLDASSKVGMTLAGIVGLRPSDNTPVFIESGLYYTERGGKNGTYDVEKRAPKGSVTRVGYNILEIPLTIKYGLKVSDQIAVLPFFGPYFSYAISGKTKQTELGKTESESVGTFDEKKACHGGLNRASMGLKLGVGAEYNKIYLELGYQFGITNIAKEENFSGRSNAFFANIGVNL
jgi:hypothetical protein